ncbi:1-acyl-sn-glycerol-3-phosphate acyltransferase [Candidatus Dependentiae bacterium]|nr:1-acyl-sn-glycerol-3-phosphate acyltransferase [Candidatus Dependentiae bacterium]
MKPIIQFLKTLYFACGVVIITVIVSILIFLFVTFKKEKKARKTFKNWGKYLFKLTGSKLEIEGLENLDSSENYLFCPNHTSAFDIYILSGYLPYNFAWISKETYFKIPFVGAAMKKLNCIEMNRSNPKKSFAALKKAADIIKQKKLSIAIFPEGTRSLDGNLQDFKRGSLYLAVETGIKIVPVAIIGTYEILPKNKYLVKKQNVKIIFSKPIDPPNKNKDSQLETLEKIKSEIKQNLLLTK